MNLYAIALVGSLIFGLNLHNNSPKVKAVTLQTVSHFSLPPGALLTPIAPTSCYLKANPYTNSGGKGSVLNIIMEAVLPRNKKERWQEKCQQEKYRMLN